MACGGSSGMDACRAGEHAPVGTTLLPKPANRLVTHGDAGLGRSRRSMAADMLARDKGARLDQSLTSQGTPGPRRCRALAYRKNVEGGNGVVVSVEHGSCRFFKKIK